MLTFGFIGTQEIIIIMVIALLVFGPAKLPEIGRQVGSALREVRKMSGDVQRALDIDGHGSYDTYSSPYSYSTPSHDSYSPQPLDQYGVDDSHAQPAAIASGENGARRPKFTAEPMPDATQASDVTQASDAIASSTATPANASGSANVPTMGNVSESVTETSAMAYSTVGQASESEEPRTLSVSAGSGAAGNAGGH
jgi:sec-independent protein translocase protein TatA